MGEQMSKIYLNIFGGIIIYAGATIYLYFNGFILNVNNYYVNVIIVFLFLIGVFRLIKLAYTLSSENKEIDKVGKCTIKVASDIDLIETKLPRSWIKSRLIQVNEILKAKGKLNHRDMAALLEKKIRNLGNLIKYIAGITILIGLLGTFLGMTESIQGFNSALNKTQSQPQNAAISSHKDIINGYKTLNNDMTNILGGIDKALGTSILGILTFIILNYLCIMYKNSQGIIANKLEEVFIVKILPHYQYFESDIITKSITESISGILPQTIKNSTEDLKVSTLNLKEITQGIKTVQGTFNELIINIKDESSALQNANKEINENLRSFSNQIGVFTKTIEVVNSNLTQNQAELQKNADVTRKNSIQITQMLINLNNSYQKLTNFINLEGKDFRKTFEDIGKSSERLPSILEKVILKLEDDRSVKEFQNLSAMIKTNFDQVKSVYSKLEESYQKISDYVSAKDVEFSDILEDINNTTKNLPVLMNKLIAKLDDDRILKEFDHIASLIKNDFSQLQTVYAKLEHSHQELKSHVSAKDSLFKSILDNEEETKQKVAVILNKVAEKLEKNHNVMDSIVDMLNDLRKDIIKAINKLKWENLRALIFRKNKKETK
jgi:hypothetical protein